MTAHELAKLLLKNPDKAVFTHGGSYDEWEEVELVCQQRVGVYPGIHTGVAGSEVKDGTFVIHIF